MEDEVYTIELDGNEFFLLDSISGNGNMYYYFSNIEDSYDINVLKDKNINGDDCFVSLDTESEFNYALSLFYKKHKDDNYKGVTN